MLFHQHLQQERHYEKGKDKMATRKQIWDAMDLLEGKKKGTTYKKLQKEMIRQGYKKKRKRRKK